MRTLVVAGLATMAAASQASIIFSNFFINSVAMTAGVPVVSSNQVINGASYTTAGNAVSFSTPGALVGDPVAPLRSAIVNLQYDAKSTAGNANVVTANVNLGAAVLGPNSSVYFLEQVFELDSLGNEVGGAIGSISHIFTAASNPNWSGAITLSRQVACLRMKKSLILAAPDTQGLDLAAVAINNQSVQIVPEPAGLAALALGGVLVLRRRSK
ncbi:MAG: PEP-CTERM sorting domain-containing protein [Chthonomonas sp.]|nr:PEP-CTERM sorting domain-containing protein [Chthonomonas sp.]